MSPLVFLKLGPQIKAFTNMAWTSTRGNFRNEIIFPTHILGSTFNFSVKCMNFLGNKFGHPLHTFVRKTRTLKTIVGNQKINYNSNSFTVIFWGWFIQPICGDFGDGLIIGFATLLC